MINCVMKLLNPIIIYTGIIAPSPHFKILPNEILLSPKTWLGFLPRIKDANENTKAPIMRKIMLFKMATERVMPFFSMGGESPGFH